MNVFSAKVHREKNAGGGFVAPAPPGSTCQTGQAKFALDVSSKMLSWEVCMYRGKSRILDLAKGSRVIADSEYAALKDSLDDVSVVAKGPCGADKPVLKLGVTTPSGTTTYLDSFYSCRGSGPFVNGIDEVLDIFQKLAK